MQAWKMDWDGFVLIFFATLIVSLFAKKKKKNIGFFRVWIIGLGIGTIIYFVLGADIGLGAGIVSSLIAVVRFSTKSEYKDEPQPKKSSSVVDELTKLNELMRKNPKK